MGKSATLVTGVVAPLLVFAVHSALAAGISQYVLQAPPEDVGSAAVAEPERPIGIVIMAQGRSGSTMLGETFRQNKDVLYWYEPCRSWGQGIFDSSSHYHREIHGEDCSGLVRRLARCEFTIEDSARLGVDPAALDSGSSELSPLRAASANPSAAALAEAHETVVRVCKQSRAVVVKTIRADAGVGGPDGDASGLLVIHLVRDPRAVINSQIKTFNVAHKYRRYFNNTPLEVNSPEGKNSTTTVPGKESETVTAGGAGVGSGLTALPWGGQERARALGLIVCGVYKDQLDSSAKLGDDRYLRVRYEDIASSAEQTVEHVYRWSGLGAVPSRVSLWINENTRLPDCGDSHAAAATAANTGIAAPGDGQETHRAVSEETNANGSASSARDGRDGRDANGAGDATATTAHRSSGSGSARDANATEGDGNVAVLGAETLGRAAVEAAAPTLRSRRLGASASVRDASDDRDGHDGHDASDASDGHDARDASDARNARDATATSREGGRDARARGANEFNREAVEAAPLTSQSRKLSAGASGSDNRGSGKTDVKCKEKMAKQVEWDRYGTRRHAAAMVGLWRTQMPKEEAEAVWEGCAESGVMDVMGYSP